MISCFQWLRVYLMLFFLVSSSSMCRSIYTPDLAPVVLSIYHETRALASQLHPHSLIPSNITHNLPPAPHLISSHLISSPHHHPHHPHHPNTSRPLPSLLFICHPSQKTLTPISQSTHPPTPCTLPSHTHSPHPHIHTSTSTPSHPNPTLPPQPSLRPSISKKLASRVDYRSRR